MGGQILVGFIGPPRGSPELKKKAKLVPANLAKVRVLDFAQILKKYLGDPDGAKLLAGLPVLPVNPPVGSIVPLTAKRDGDSAEVDPELLDPAEPSDSGLWSLNKHVETRSKLPDTLAEKTQIQVGSHMRSFPVLSMLGREDLIAVDRAGVEEQDDEGRDEDAVAAYVPEGDKVVSLKSKKFSLAKGVSLKISKGGPSIDFYLRRLILSHKSWEQYDSRLEIDPNGQVPEAITGEVMKEAESETFNYGKGFSTEAISSVETTGITHKRMTNISSGRTLNMANQDNAVDIKRGSMNNVKFPLEEILLDVIPSGKALSEEKEEPIHKWNATNRVQLILVKDVADVARGDVEKSLDSSRLGVRLKMDRRLPKMDRGLSRQPESNLGNEDHSTVKGESGIPLRGFRKGPDDGYLKVQRAVRGVHFGGSHHTGGHLKSVSGGAHHYVWVVMSKVEKVGANTHADLEGDIKHQLPEYTPRRLAQVVVRWANANVQRIPASAEMEVKGIGLVRMSLDYDKHLGGLKLEIRIIQPSGGERIFEQIDLKAAEQMIRDGLSRIGVLSVSVRFEGGAGNTWQQVSSSSSPGKGGIGNSMGHGAGQSSYQMMREMVNLLAHLKRERKGE